MTLVDAAMAVLSKSDFSHGGSEGRAYPHVRQNGGKTASSP